MRLLLLIVVAYLCLAIDTTLRAEWCPLAPFAGLMWAMLPVVAARVHGTRGLILAALMGLGVDGCSGHWPGIGVCLAVTAAWLMQRAFVASELRRWPSRLAATLICSITLSPMSIDLARAELRIREMSVPASSFR